MSQIRNINAVRIRWCANQIGLAQEDLSRELRIADSTFSRLFEGGGGLSFDQLRRLADFFCRSVFFFLEEGEIKEDEADSPQFRTLTNQNADVSPKIRRIIKQTEEQRSRYLMLLDALGENDPAFAPPDLCRSNPEEAARVAREWLGITDQNTFDEYRKAIEAAGVLVFRSNGFKGRWQIPRESKILGFSIYERVCPVIFVRKQPAVARQMFTLAHELGHLLLHGASSIDDEIDLEAVEGQEQEANKFAGAFLVPQNALDLVDTNMKPDDPSDFEDWVSSVRSDTGASTEVVLLRLLMFNRLSLDDYRAYRDWKSDQTVEPPPGGSRAYRYREPRHLFGDVFVKTVLDAINAKKIPITKASKYLDNLKLTDIHKLEEFYAGF